MAARSSGPIDQTSQTSTRSVEVTSGHLPEPPSVDELQGSMQTTCGCGTTSAIQSQQERGESNSQFGIQTIKGGAPDAAAPGETLVTLQSGPVW